MTTLTPDLVRSADMQARADLSVPPPEMLDLPETVVQFGTGGFLRAFADFFFDQALRQGLLEGRVVVVGSTGSGRTATLNEQGGLYTVQVQGLADGARVNETHILGAISRALSARDQWDEVLQLAHNPDLELIVSNTTEVGITLDDDDQPDLDPPRSFPGKLTMFLFERARAFDFDPSKGVVVLPCELLEQNGDLLREIVYELADRWSLGREFKAWVGVACPFCNTLVDRIVPGFPDDAEARWTDLGYRDDLLLTAEPYRFWAIEADDTVQERLAFAEADSGILLTDDVGPYRERKVYVLNGAHTILVPVAVLSGCATVREATTHPLVGRFLRHVLFEEIVPTLSGDDAHAFAEAVMDRFANPFIRHDLLDISLEQTGKLAVRVIPSLVRYADTTGRVPHTMAFGFACYLLFVRGGMAPQPYTPKPDRRAERVAAWWDGVAVDDEAALRAVAATACEAEDLWGLDLHELPGFVEAVQGYLVDAAQHGVTAALERWLEAVGQAET